MKSGYLLGKLVGRRRLVFGKVVEPAKGLEPPTGGLRNRCSAPELRWRGISIADGGKFGQWSRGRLDGKRGMSLTHGGATSTIALA